MQFAAFVTFVAIDAAPQSPLTGTIIQSLISNTPHVEVRNVSTG